MLSLAVAPAQNLATPNRRANQPYPGLARVHARFALSLPGDLHACQPVLP